MSRDDAERKGIEAIRQIGCSEVTDIPSCLRAAPVTSLLGALANVGREVTGQRRDDPWGPVAGTPYLPRQPIDAIRHGSAAGIPLLIGSTHDEMRGFVLGRHANMTPEEYSVLVRATFGDAADDVLRQYPATNFAAPTFALATVLTDWGGGIGACPTLVTARAASRHTRVYAYEFGEGSPPFGAYHGFDLPFLWTTSIPGSQYPAYADMTPDQQRLGRAMIGYWSAFAHRGDPNVSGLPRWIRADSRSTSVLGLSAGSIAPVPFATDHKCQFWNSI
jgi:para-nitrobenzyl esterase